MNESIADIFRFGFDEFEQFVNPLIAQRAKLSAEPIHFVRCEEGVLFDVHGRGYEDFHGTQMLGHRNGAITAAVRAFLDSDAPNFFPSRVNPWAGRLARKLCERTGYSNVYFGMSGADAVEAALKLARAATGKPRIIGLQGGYHGCSFGAVSLMQDGPLYDPFGPHLAGAEKIPFGDLDALHRSLATQDVCAVVVEPIQGEGGGRAGQFLASSSWPRQPDVALIAKPLGGGLAPISATLSHRKIFDAAYKGNFFLGQSHNSTFGNNGLTSVAALAMLELLSDELIAPIVKRGEDFRSMLQQALQGNPLFIEARGIGYMLGVQLRQPSHPWLSFDHLGFPEFNGQATIGLLLCHRLYRRGFFTFVCGHDWTVLRLQPRLDISPAKLAEFVQCCKEELDLLAQLGE